MKCPTCGNNLQLEEVTCSFCGSANPYFAQHQEDMEQYREEFSQAKNSAMARAERFNFTTAKITVIAVLVALCLLMVFLIGYAPYEIGQYMTKKDINDNLAQYMAVVDSYEEDGDWLMLYSFINEKKLTYDDRFDGYYVIQYMARDYYSIEETILDIYAGDYNRLEYSYGDIASYLEKWNSKKNRVGYEGSWYDSCYSGKHKEAMEQQQEDLYALLETYMGLTPEEINQLWDYSQEKKTEILMEKMAAFENEYE